MRCEEMDSYVGSTLGGVVVRAIKGVINVVSHTITPTDTTVGVYTS